ncbi:GNAT family N-acetyltransferase [Amycolatopsis sp. NPDC054798]
MFDPGGLSGLPFRSARQHARCLDGRHDLRIAHVTTGYHHEIGLHSITCLACDSARRNSWFVVEHRPQDWTGAVGEMHAQRPVLLVPRRPAVPGGAGRIDLQVRGELWAYALLQLCAVDRRAILVRVAVAEPHRRRGLGTLLVDAALAHGEGYTWSTAEFDAADDVLRAFRASLDPAEPVTVAHPHYCSHMHLANGQPDQL